MTKTIPPDALMTDAGRFQLLVESINDYAIYMLDPDGIVVSWNNGAQRFKGYNADEIIGRHFSTFYTPEDREIDLPGTALKTARIEGKFEQEGWRLRKDGSRMWAHVVIDAIHDNAGKLVGFAKITRDITERRETQLALEEAREAAFLAQKSEALGQLTGGVAHDFNNMLMIIMSSIELAGKRVPDDPKLKRYLSNAMQGARRGAALTQRMLAFARHQDLHLDQVSVSDLIEGMRDLMERSIGPGINILTYLPFEQLHVLADANQLELVLLNLTVNARDAMPDGGSITISVRRETNGDQVSPALKPGSYVCTSIADTGQGMDQKTLARATEPFFTTKGVGKGTGLGLSMAQGLCQQLGGALLIHTGKGVGTTVEIWLPEFSKDSSSPPPDS